MFNLMYDLVVNLNPQKVLICVQELSLGLEWSVKVG